MKIILIGVLAFTAVAVMEALFYTLRFLSDRRDDELKRRLSSLGSADSTGNAPGSPGSSGATSCRRTRRSTPCCAR